MWAGTKTQCCAWAGLIREGRVHTGSPCAMLKRSSARPDPQTGSLLRHEGDSSPHAQ